jgi:hypothetical protein
MKIENKDLIIDTCFKAGKEDQLYFIKIKTIEETYHIVYIRYILMNNTSIIVEGLNSLYFLDFLNHYQYELCSIQEFNDAISSFFKKNLQ